MAKKHKLAKACDISQEVRKKVYERDGGICVICEIAPGAPNCHYIPRSDMGLGIEENVVCACPTCHHKYDNGGQREEIKEIIRTYLQGKYPQWDEKKLRYNKYDWINGD